MKTITINFYECEHNGDLDDYFADIRKAGGNVINVDHNFEAETAEVELEVENIKTFLIKFIETDGCDFSQYQHLKYEDNHNLFK